MRCVLVNVCGAEIIGYFLCKWGVMSQIYSQGGEGEYVGIVCGGGQVRRKGEKRCTAAGVLCWVKSRGEVRSTGLARYWLEGEERHLLLGERRGDIKEREPKVGKEEKRKPGQVKENTSVAAGS
jgi:hypothetical protein